MIRKMKDDEFAKVISIIERSFPRDERRPADEEKALLADPRFTIYVSDDVSAMITVWQFDEFAFIEHFAVDPDHRCGGLGGKMLQELISILPCPVCLETEPPIEDIQKRRISFYTRNGLFLNHYTYYQPPISAGRNTIPLMLMTSGGEVSEADYRRIRGVLYREVYNIGSDFIATHYPNG